MFVHTFNYFKFYPMKNLKLLLLFSVLLAFAACRKESNSLNDVSETTNNLGPIVKKINVADPGYSEVALTYNATDNSYSGIIFGSEIKFTNVIYDILYDQNGNVLAPKDGDPVYATVAFNPNDASSQWSLIAAPDAPSNQFIFQVPSTYMEPYYPNLDNFWADVDTYRNNYANQLSAAWHLIYAVQWNLPSNVTVGVRVNYNPPRILNYISTVGVGGSGNRLIVGALVKKADGSIAARIADVPLS